MLGLAPAAVFGATGADEFELEDFAPHTDQSGMGLGGHMTRNAMAGGRSAGSILSDGIIDALARLIVAGELTIRYTDGSIRTYTGAEPGPRAELHIHGSRTARRLVSGGALGFAEAYMAGEWDTPDLAAFLELASRNEEVLADRLNGRALIAAIHRLVHLLRRNTRRGSRRNIAAHYDLGNDFYQAWLDESMTYSSAIFPAQDCDLGEAQRAKYRRIADAAGLRQGDRVLEIGCGWGGFACFAAGEIGCDVTALTISQQQHDFAAERVQREGLVDRVRIVKRDYRDEEGLFDRIVSIEMFEAVGERYWPVFFDRIRRNLAAGGRAALQVITIADEHWPAYRKGADFIQRYIFPGGMLPSPGRLRQEFERAGLAVASDAGFGLDYARTLNHWRQRFEHAWPRLREMGFDERFRKMWTYYLAYCEAGFRTRHIDVRQIALTRE